MSTISTLTDAQLAALSAVGGACANQPCSPLAAVAAQVLVATAWEGWFVVRPSSVNLNGVDLAALRTAIDELVALGLVLTGTVGGRTVYSVLTPGLICQALV